MTSGYLSLTETNEGLIGMANYALRSLGCSRIIKHADDVDAKLLVDLGINLFGDTFSSLVSIIMKLSEEIGTNLDHIVPHSLISGERRSISNLLELIAAFIHFSSNNGLLDFTDTSGNYGDSSISLNRMYPANRHEDPAYLSTSPELPRSVSRPCPGLSTSNTKLAATPLPYSLFSDYTETYSTKGRYTLAAAPDFDVASTGGENLPISLQSAQPMTPVRKAFPAGTPATAFQTRRSLLSFQMTNMSPPATPQAADDLFEIDSHNSPREVLPSLQSSPVSREVQQNFPFKGNCSLSRTSASSSSSSVQPTIDVRLPSCTQSVKSPVHARSVRKPMFNLANTYNKTGSPVEFTNLTHLPQAARRHQRKASSSSSGCGHSPTQTLTAPGASLTSMPDSPSESLSPCPVLDSHSVHADKKVDSAADVYGQSTVSTQPPKLTGAHAQSLRVNSRTNLVPGSGRSTGTNSILAWNAENILPPPEVPLTNGSYSASSRLCKDDDHCTPIEHDDSLGPSLGDTETSSYPSTSVLLARSEGFSQSLKRRLNYLQNMFHRAHDEAQAVSNLVKSIASQNADALGQTRLKRSCIKDSGTGRTKLSAVQSLQFSPSTTMHLERIMYKLSDGVDAILNSLKRIEREPIYRDRISVTDHIPQRASFPFAAKVSVPFWSGTTPPRLRRRNTRRYPSVVGDVLDLEFFNLMDVKHRCMMDGLQQYLQHSLRVPNEILHRFSL